MKKTFVLLVMVTLLLVGCNKKVNYEDLKDLEYYEYLNKDNPVVTIKVKTFGTIELQLFPEVASISVNNFISYINDKAYDSSIFHRVIKEFMIQGGIVTNSKPPIKGEFAANGIKNNLKHYRGIISMARTLDMNSATSQFFIVDKTSPHLDGHYAAFGGVINGFDVIDKIANVAKGNQDKPVVDVVISSVRVKNN